MPSIHYRDAFLTAISNSFRRSDSNASPLAGRPSFAPFCSCSCRSSNSAPISTRPSVGPPKNCIPSWAWCSSKKATWTNAQAVEAYLFRTDVQFALNLEPGLDEMCDRTLERYRALFLEDDLAAKIMNDVTLELVDALELQIDQQR